MICRGGGGGGGISMACPIIRSSHFPFLRQTADGIDLKDGTNMGLLGPD